MVQRPRWNSRDKTIALLVKTRSRMEKSEGVYVQNSEMFRQRMTDTGIDSHSSSHRLIRFSFYSPTLYRSYASVSSSSSLRRRGDLRSSTSLPPVYVYVCLCTCIVVSLSFVSRIFATTEPSKDPPVQKYKQHLLSTGMIMKLLKLTSRKYFNRGSSRLRYFPLLFTINELYGVKI